VNVAVPESIYTGVAHQIGHYADAYRVPAGYELIFVSGTPGLTADGARPDDFSEEARQAWRNVQSALENAGAALGDIVSVRQWLTDADDLAAYVAVRAQVLTHEPAFMLAIVSGLVWPNLRIEIEVVAARPAS
jgi:2-iminobutanoate/2-iminopropanoate deaminase